MAEKQTVDAYIAKLTDDQREIVEKLRRLIQENAPQAKESIKWAQPVYEVNGPFAYIKAATKHITFGFWRGVALDEGRGQLESSGSAMAHTKIRSADEIDIELLGAFVRKAVALNQSDGDPTKRK